MNVLGEDDESHQASLLLELTRPSSPIYECMSERNNTGDMQFTAQYTLHPA